MIGREIVGDDQDPGEDPVVGEDLEGEEGTGTKEDLVSHPLILP